MIRRPPRSTLDRSSAASDVYKRQEGKIRTRSWEDKEGNKRYTTEVVVDSFLLLEKRNDQHQVGNIVNEEEGISPEKNLSLIHISEPTRPY